MHIQWLYASSRYHDCFLLPALILLITERDAGRSKYEPDRGDRGTEVGAGEGLLPIPTATATFPVPTLSSTITVIAPQGNHSNSIASVTDSWSDFHPDQSLDRPLPPQRKRCRDYDGKQEGSCFFFTRDCLLVARDQYDREGECLE